ncbi:MAG: HAD family phosphatase [Gammaproteobacteria bacterium]|nr:MAG: HAD family phosphatase [Gammaproteobacteria bacterium]
MNTRPIIDFSLAPYENVIFDFAGVLFECDYLKMVRRVFPAAHNHAELADKIFKSDVFVEYDKDLIDQEELLLKLSSLALCQLKDIENLIEVIKEYLVPMEESILLLYALKEMNIKLYGLTNMPKEIYDHLIKKYEFLKLFEHITSSSYVKLAKPDPAIYQKLISLTGIDVTKTIFTDDRVVNLHPAEKLGVKSILFKDANQFLQELRGMMNINFIPQNDSEKRVLGNRN